MLEFIAHRFLLGLFCRGRTLSLTVLAGATLLSATSSAYLIDGTKWLRGEAEFYVAVPGLSSSEISWNSAVIDALNNWSTNTLFNFTVIEEYKDPCVIDGFSSIDFREDFCGSELAQTLLRLRPAALKSRSLVLQISSKATLWSIARSAMTFSTGH